jgi:hypothetical protein
MQAVGAMPEVAPPSAPPAKRPLPPPPSLRIEIIALVISLVVVGLTFLPRRSTPTQVIAPTITAAPTVTPLPTVTPTNIIPINPYIVKLSTGVLYGDYEEDAKIGPAPEGLSCTLAGQSPDRKWAHLSCPAPTNHVWAKVADLELTDTQREKLLDMHVISHMVPTVGTFSPPVPQDSGPSLAFCAERSSIWGKTRQCAATQAAADALADNEMRAINATAEALQRQR